MQARPQSGCIRAAHAWIKNDIAREPGMGGGALRPPMMAETPWHAHKQCHDAHDAIKKVSERIF